MTEENRLAAKRITSLIAKHHRFRSNSLNMIPAENVTSPSLREIVASDLMHRYGEYEQQNIEKRWDEGNIYTIEIEKTTRDLAKKLFDVEYVDLRPVSGTQTPAWHGLFQLQLWLEGCPIPQTGLPRLLSSRNRGISDSLGLHLQKPSSSLRRSSTLLVQSNPIGSLHL